MGRAFFQYRKQCNIFKLHITLIQVKFTIRHVTCKIYILQSIAIKVPNTHATTIIKIFVHQNIGTQALQLRLLLKVIWVLSARQ